MASNSRYPCRRGRNEKNESRTVFENLKATFLEHLTHARFISRKVGFSRRCPAKTTDNLQTLIDRGGAQERADSPSVGPVSPIAEPAQRGLRAAERHVFRADPTIEAGPVDGVEHEPIVDLAGPRLMPSGAVSDLEVLDPVEVRQNRFGQVPARPLQVIDVAEDAQVLVPHLVEEAHGGRHGRQQKARYVDGVEWLDKMRTPARGGLLSGVEQALSHARPLGLEWHVRQRDPYVAEQLRAAQLIGDRERAGDAVAELDPAPRAVGDTDLASGMVAPGQVELHLPQPIARECRPDRAHVLAVRLRELHGLEASRGCTVEPLQERVLREEPLDLPAPYVAQRIGASVFLFEPRQRG